MLLDLLNTLRKNEENVGKEVLKTKYASAYKKLKDEIWEAYILEVKSFIAGDLKVDEDFNLYEKISEAFNNNAELINQGYKVLLETYSLEQAINTVLPLAEEVKEIYLPYWLSKCVQTNKGTYNILNGGYWDPEKNAWVIKTNITWDGKTKEIVYYEDKFPPYTMVQAA